jgi:hypothetical protein
MQIGPPPSGVQALAGALDSAAVRQQLGATRTDSARAVSALTKSDNGQTTDFKAKRDAQDDDRTQPRPRGSLVDLRV